MLSRVGGLPQLCLPAPDDRLNSRVLAPPPTLRPGAWLSPPPWSPQEWPSLGGDWECWGRGRRDLSQAGGQGINLLLPSPHSPPACLDTTSRKPPRLLHEHSSSIYHFPVGLRPRWGCLGHLTPPLFVVYPPHTPPRTVLQFYNSLLLLMRKPRVREAEQLAQGHTGGRRSRTWALTLWL